RSAPGRVFGSIFIVEMLRGCPREAEKFHAVILDLDAGLVDQHASALVEAGLPGSTVFAGEAFGAVDADAPPSVEVRKPATVDDLSQGAQRRPFITREGRKAGFIGVEGRANAGANVFAILILADH